MFLGAPVTALVGGGANGLADYAPLLVPLATIVTGYLAYLGIKRGKGIEDSQQRAKNKLEDRAQTFSELSSLNEKLNDEIKRLEAARDAEVTRVRLQAEQRDDSHGASEKRCARQLDRALGQLDTLRSVVLNEVMKASTGRTIDEIKDHLAGHEPDNAPP